jgi:Zn-dependent protease
VAEEHDDLDDHSRISFGRREIRDLILASVILSAGMAFVLGGRVGDPGTIRLEFDWDAFFTILPFAALATIPAFILHELAHKIVAQKKDLAAEFLVHPWGLSLAMLTPIVFKLLLAAPGVVEIYDERAIRGGGPDTRPLPRVEAIRLFGLRHGLFASKSDRRWMADELDAGAEPHHIRQDLAEQWSDAGIISIVGPLVNLILAYAAFILDGIFPGVRVPASEASGIGESAFNLILIVNLVLAAFNMMPINPFDGRKILRWSSLAFLGMWSLILGLLALWILVRGLL